MDGLSLILIGVIITLFVCLFGIVIGWGMCTKENMKNDKRLARDFMTTQARGLEQKQNALDDAKSKAKRMTNPEGKKLSHHFGNENVVDRGGQDDRALEHRLSNQSNGNVNPEDSKFAEWNDLVESGDGIHWT